MTGQRPRRKAPPLDLTHAQPGWWVVYRTNGIGFIAAKILENRHHMGDLLLDNDRTIGYDSWMRKGGVIAVYPEREQAMTRVRGERRAKREREDAAVMARRDTIEARALRAAIVRRLSELPLSELRLVAAFAEAEVRPRTTRDIAPVDVAIRLLVGGCSPSDIGREVGEAEQPSLIGTRLIRTLRARGYPVEHVSRGLWRLGTRAEGAP